MKKKKRERREITPVSERKGRREVVNGNKGIVMTEDDRSE